MEFSSNLSAIYTKWGTQTFQLIFGLFTIFNRNFFAKIVAPPSGENKNSIALLKIWWKPHQNRRINRDTLLIQTMTPSSEQHAGLRAWQTKKQTRNQKRHLKGNAIPAGCNAECCATWLELILNSNQTKYLPHTLRPSVYIFEKFHRKFEICVAPTTDGTMKRLVHCKAHLVFWQPMETASKTIYNWRRILPQTATKLMKTCGSEFCGLQWCHLMKGSVKEPNILLYFFFPPITQSCSVSDVLFTGGRGVSDFTVLK